MTSRYIRLREVTASALEPPVVRLRIGIFEHGDACAVALLTNQRDERSNLRWGAVIPRELLDDLFASLDLLHVWDLPAESSFTETGDCPTETHLWLSDSMRNWHRDSAVANAGSAVPTHPDPHESARFAEVVDRITRFAFEHAKDEVRPTFAACETLEASEIEGAAEFAEELRQWAELRRDGHPDSLPPGHYSETGGLGLRWTLFGHQGPVDSCAISADGALVASAGEDFAIRIWDARKGAVRWVLGNIKPPTRTPAGLSQIAFDVKERNFGAATTVRALGFSHDGRYLAEVWSDFVTLWNLEQSAAWDLGIREQLACTGCQGYEDGWVQAFQVNEDEGLLRLWFALFDDSVKWMDVEREDGCLVDWGQRIPNIRQIVFRPDGCAVIAITPSAEVSVGPVPKSMRARSTAEIVGLHARKRNHEFYGRELVLAAGNIYGLLGKGSTARVVPMTGGSQLAENRSIDLDGKLVSCAVARDQAVGVTACIGARNDSVCVWDLDRLVPIRTIAVHNVTDCAISADGHVIVTSSASQPAEGAGANGVVQVWDV